MPTWFSPKHAGEKFKHLCLELAVLAMEVEKTDAALGSRTWELQRFAEEYARIYVTECPVQSVRVMEPSGAIFVILDDGREVLVPQP